MQTRIQALERFTLNEAGRITEDRQVSAPHRSKYLGEPLYVPVFWEAFQHRQRTGKRVDGHVEIVLKAADYEQFPELTDKPLLMMVSCGSGSVSELLPARNTVAAEKVMHLVLQINLNDLVSFDANSGQLTLKVPEGQGYNPTLVAAHLCADPDKGHLDTVHLAIGTSRGKAAIKCNKP